MNTANDTRKPPLSDPALQPITVLVVDDHSIVRSGLRALLETAADIQVIGEAENGQQAVRDAKRLKPNVVLMDLAMPMLNGVEAARQIAHTVPSSKVLILSSYSDEEHVRQAVEAGVAGYLMKESAGEDLLNAVRATRNGEACFSPPLFRRLLKEWQGVREDGCARPAHLSRRQAEILQLIAEGYASKQIASLLPVSIKTVEKHRQALMGKLGLYNIASLTRYAISSGVIESNPRSGWMPRSLGSSLEVACPRRANI